MRRELCAMTALTVCLLGGCVVQPERPAWLDEYNGQFAEVLWTHWQEAEQEHRQDAIKAAIESAIEPFQDAPSRLRDLEEMLGEVNGGLADALNEIRSDVREFEVRLPQSPPNVSVDTFVDEQLRKITRSLTSAIKDSVDALEGKIARRLEEVENSVRQRWNAASLASELFRGDVDGKLATINGKMDVAANKQDRFVLGIEDLSILRDPVTRLFDQANSAGSIGDLEAAKRLQWYVLGGLGFMLFGVIAAQIQSQRRPRFMHRIDDALRRVELLEQDARMASGSAESLERTGDDVKTTMTPPRKPEPPDAAHQGG